MKSTLLLLTMLVMSLLTHNLLASTHLPAQYPLKKILITISNQTNRNTPEGYYISINGNGNSFYTRNNQAKQDLTVTNDTLLELVNEFYTIHFFELVDNYALKKQVVLKDNKTVTTIRMKQSEMNSKKICIQLRTFKKCVTIVDDQPVGVAQLVKKIEDLFIPKQEK